MKKLLTSVAAAALLSLPLLSFAANYDIDPDHSSVGFKVRHMMVSNVTGSFEKHSGVVEINDKEIAKSKVSVTIDAASVNTNMAKRDAHLKSADFFDVAKYPTITFVSRKVAKSGKGKLKVTGDLTLHGVTRQVVLDVEGPTRESKDPWGNLRSGVVASTKINRKDFGLVYNAALETGGVAVGEEVAINLEIEMIKAKP
ncbi:MAG TPA: protein yceI precursor [Geobacter sp.]|nr:protein yceI precursor [Geobacter sp.]